MKFYKKLMLLLVVALAGLAFSCDIAGEGESIYSVSILGYDGDYLGGYKVDGDDEWTYFTGDKDDTYDIYEKNIDLDFSSSLTIWVQGNEQCTSLSFWFYINEELYNSAAITSNAEFLGDEGAISTYASIDFYYEPTSTTE